MSSDPRKDARELQALMQELVRLEAEMDLTLKKANQVETDILFSQIIFESFGDIDLQKTEEFED